MDFKAYQHVERLGTSEVENILDTDCVEVMSKLDGCFSPYTKVLMADGTDKFIKDLLVGEQVLSYNFKTEKLEPKKINNVYKHKCSDVQSEFITLVLHNVYANLHAKQVGVHSRIAVTKNHKIFIQDSNGIIKEAYAGELVVGDRILSTYTDITEAQKQSIYALALGDGSPTSNKSINRGMTFTYGEKQKEHAEFVGSIWGKGVRFQQHVNGYIEDSNRYQGCTNITKATNNVVDRCYIKDTTILNLSNKWLSKISPFGLAMWYMDDGSLVPRKSCLDTARLHTEVLNYEDNKKLAEWLFSLGLEFHIHKETKKDKCYWFLSLMKDSAKKFWDMIYKFIIPSMQYKLPEEYRNGYDKDLVDKLNTVHNIDIITGEIKSVIQGVSYRSEFNGVKVPYKYDLEIEGNHNYFAGNMLVHNSNGCIYLNNDGELECGSRKRVLSLHNDNAGVYKYVMEHRTGYEAYLMHHPTHRIYGEWLVKHTVTGYKDSAWRKIYIFDIYDETENRYLRFDEYVEEISNLGLDYIPPIAILDHPTLEEVQSYVDKCTFLMQDEQAGEGIVIHSPEYRNKYGHQVWAKIVRKEFKQTKKHPSKHIDDARLESDIIYDFCTEEFIKKEYAKIVTQEGKWTSKMIPRLLNTVWHEFVKEESYNFVKKYKCPTINFKQLQGLCTEKVKETLPTLF